MQRNAPESAGDHGSAGILLTFFRIKKAKLVFDLKLDFLPSGNIDLESHLTYYNITLIICCYIARYV